MRALAALRSAPGCTAQCGLLQCNLLNYLTITVLSSIVQDPTSHINRIPPDHLNRRSRRQPCRVSPANQPFVPGNAIRVVYRKQVYAPLVLHIFGNS